MRLRELSIVELRQLYSRKEVTPSEVAEDWMAAVDDHEGEVGAYLEVFRDDTLRAARKITESGDFTSRPLTGIPVAIKDNICTRGRRTSCASKILEGYKSPYNATVIDRLENAGAIVCGKTNLDEFAMGSSTENSAIQKTHNPWGLEHAPGGSSGGSAAAVAAAMAYASLGSDTGGSIRQPASFCGVVGMKPTYGRVSRYGLVAFASSLDQIGPLARTVHDTAHVLGVISGMDPLDSTSSSHPPEDYSAELDRGLDGLTVGVPYRFLTENMDETVRKNFDRVVTDIESSGIKVREVELPHAQYAVAAYYIVANAEASANLARYDGVRYGRRSPTADDLLSVYTRTRDEGFGAEVKRRVLLGTYVLSAGYYDAYYHKAQQIRSLVIGDFHKAFESCDTIMIPTAPSPAFRLGEKIDDPVAMYLSDIFTIPVSLAGLPAISIPAGLSSQRLPLGVQLIGRAFAESTVLRAAAGVEKLVDFKERAFE